MKIGDVSFYGLIPVIAFTISACVLTMVRSLRRVDFKLHLAAGVSTTIAAAVVTIVSSAARWRQFDVGTLNRSDLSTLNRFVFTDRLSSMSAIVISAIVIIASLVAASYLSHRDDIPSAEFFILLQCVCAGMIAITMAGDLVAMFIALELFSIPLYVLTAFDRRRVRSLEAGFKYFIMGAVSSAIFLYGIALHYGVAGTTSLTSPAETSVVASISMVLILIGLLFKVAAVPFHFWSPDAYQGAPSPITMFMSAATKLAAFVALLRIISSGTVNLGAASPAGRIVLTVACVGSALVGSIVALRQANIKRAVAYSSISHTAYILLALKGGTDASFQAVMTYVVTYAFVIAGTFAIISLVTGSEEKNDSLASMRGLSNKHPYLAGSLTILLFANAGIPLTSGFIAKFDVFRVAFAEKFYITGMIVLVATVIAAAFYLRIVLALYENAFSHEEAVPTESNEVVPIGATIAIAVCVAVTVAVGVFPSLLTGFTHVL